MRVNYQANVTPQRRRLRSLWEGAAWVCDQAGLQGAMVIGLTTKTERLLDRIPAGPAWGPVCEPLGDLYALQVQEIVRALNWAGGLPDRRVAPRAWGDLGLGPQELDGLLYQIVDVRLSLARLVELGVAEEKVRSVYRRLKEAAFRNQAAAVAEAVSVYVPRSWVLDPR